MTSSKKWTNFEKLKKKIYEVKLKNNLQKIYKHDNHHKQHMF